jgi:hypothetical protein
MPTAPTSTPLGRASLGPIQSPRPGSIAINALNALNAMNCTTCKLHMLCKTVLFLCPSNGPASTATARPTAPSPAPLGRSGLGPILR